MKWVDAKVLTLWAEQQGAPETLPVLVGQLIRASATDITTFRFPGGNSGKIHGWDGRLTATSRDPYKSFVPEGNSVWECSTEKNPRAKAERDYKKRSDDAGGLVDPRETTLVLVTARVWATPDKWIAEKKEQGVWKDIRVLDAVDLEEWLALCPAVAAAFARDNGFPPLRDAMSVDEYWDMYSRRFERPLTEAVVLAGRTAQQQEIERALVSGKGIQRCKGDSLEEVLAFVCAVVRSAEDSTKAFLGSRAIILQTEHGARQLKDRENLLFIVRGEATHAAGMVGHHRVIVPVGREDMHTGTAISLVRPTIHEMSEALKTMEFVEEEALRLAHESGKSITVLSRRIPSATAPRSEWSNNPLLMPALLGGAWDQASEADRTIMVALAGKTSYEEVEGSLRVFLSSADAPLEIVGTIWSVRAPVDLFAQTAHLLQNSHWTSLEEAIKIVFAEKDPALDLPPSERMYASLSSNVLKHTTWIRDGLSTTLLILATIGEQSGLRIRGGSPQSFVNNLVANIPGLKDDYRVLASLSHQLPMLMEAAPDPLFDALEHLLEGDSATLKPIFQDGKEASAMWSHSPHTGLLWALEVAAQDPQHLHRAAAILGRLVAIDPGGSLSNRPLRSFKDVFLPWFPATNALHEMRLAVLDSILASEPDVAWTLILSLIPERCGIRFGVLKPRFREAGASAREKLTYKVFHDTTSWIVGKAIELASVHADRWQALLQQADQLPEQDRQQIVDAFVGRRLLKQTNLRFGMRYRS